jgi:hypothetical protein
VFDRPAEKNNKKRFGMIDIPVKRYINGKFLNKDMILNRTYQVEL